MIREKHSQQIVANFKQKNDERRQEIRFEKKIQIVIVSYAVVTGRQRHLFSIVSGDLFLFLVSFGHESRHAPYAIVAFFYLFMFNHIRIIQTC